MWAIRAIPIILGFILSLVAFGAAVRLFGWEVPPASAAGVLTGWVLAVVVKLVRDRQTRR